MSDTALGGRPARGAAAAARTTQTALVLVLASGLAAAAAPPAPPTAVAEQAPAPPASGPAVLEVLIGTWEGEGELFGQPASFSMSWSRSLDGRFLRLAFENRLVDADGASTTVLEAIAFYRVADAGELRGNWFDTRGELVELQAVATDTELQTRWISESEEGRTTYRVIDTDTVEVTDEVLGTDGYRLFGAARYRRAGVAGAAEHRHGAGPAQRRGINEAEVLAGVANRS